MLLAASLALTVVASIAWANHSVFERVSSSNVGGNGPFDVTLQGASVDASRAFFVTNEALAVGDTDNRSDVYQRFAGVTTLVSRGQINGNSSTFDAVFVGASADGTRAFFTTGEALVASDTDSQIDVYERSGGATKRVTAGQINGNGALGSFLSGVSADGTRVFFDTHEQLAANDTDNAIDLYQRSGGATSRVSRGQINGNGAFDVKIVFGLGRTSADGTRVFFTTKEPLAADDTDVEEDIYERSGGTTKRVSAGQINGNGAFTPTFRRASPDGTRIFFLTNEPLVADDTDTAADVYERSGDATSRVSRGQINGSGAFDASFVGASTDGTRAFFQTKEQLVANDTDNGVDVYERSGGTTKRISAGQINGNAAFFDASFSGASADGTRVFFVTNEPLAAGDADVEQDLYERYGGGTKRVSSSSVNGNGGFFASFAGASADGTRVFFFTPEPLVANDTDSTWDIYERSGGVTSLVSRGQINGNGAFDASIRFVSADGTRVFFDTFEGLETGDVDEQRDTYSASVAP